MFKFIAVVAALGAVIALGLTIDLQSQPATRDTDPSYQVFHIAAPGRIEGITAEIELRPKQFGEITEIMVREGQQIVAGQVLLRVDDDLARHEVDLKASEVADAEAARQRLINGARAEEINEAFAKGNVIQAKLKAAQQRWRRISPLLEKNAVTPQEADDTYAQVASLTAEAAAAEARLELLKAPPRKDDLSAAEARIGAARARLKQAITRREQTQLRAPGAGKILEIIPHVGEMAGPNTQEPAILMADTSRFYVRAFVEELDAPRVRVGMQATITADGFPDRRLTGRVSRLSPRMSRKALRTDQPGERVDTKVREVWIELSGTADTPQLDLVVGLRVDVLIDPRQSVVEKAQSELPAHRQAAHTPTGRRGPRHKPDPFAVSVRKNPHRGSLADR